MYSKELLESDAVAINYDMTMRSCEDGLPLGELRAVIFRDRTNVVMLIRQGRRPVVHDASPK